MFLSGLGFMSSLFAAYDKVVLGTVLLFLIFWLSKRRRSVNVVRLSCTVFSPALEVWI